MGKYNLNTLMYKLLTTLCSTRKKKREHSCRHERTEYTRGFYHPTLNEHGTTSCLGTSLPYFESLQSELTANTNAKYFPGCQKYIKIRNYKIISASSYAKSLSTLIIHSSSPGGGPGITSPILVRSPLCQLVLHCWAMLHHLSGLSFSPSTKWEEGSFSGLLPKLL